MVASINEIPTDAPGKIILNAQLYAAPGQAERLQEILTNIQKNANSDAEPGCSDYRPARSFVKEGVIKFTIWEVYKDAAAFKVHGESKAFAELMAGIQGGDLLDGPPVIEFFYEF